MIVYDIMGKPNLIIVLLYIFKQSTLFEFAKVLEHKKSYMEEGLGDYEDFELNMITAISTADIAFMT